MRAHTRYAVEVPVGIASVDGPTNQPQSSGSVLFDTRDLSAGGAFLQASSLLEVGEEVALEFRLGGGRLVRARCRVVRVERSAPTGMGITFTKLDEQDRAALKAFVASRGG
jgi:c-di-GMP-binding flagellar brake protein YcgR